MKGNVKISWNSNCCYYFNQYFFLFSSIHCDVLGYIAKFMFWSEPPECIRYIAIYVLSCRVHPIYCDVFCPAERLRYMTCRLTSDISTKEFLPLFETFNISCNHTIPPFPHPGNFSSFYSHPKEESSIPSLSLKTDGSWSSAEGRRGGAEGRNLVLVGVVGKKIGLNTQHWGEIWSYCHINPFSARRGLIMQQLCCQQQERKRSSSLAGCSIVSVVK